MVFYLKDVIVRKASVSDIDSLVGLLEEIFSIEEDFIFDEQKQRKGLLLMLEAQDKRCVMVAEMNKKIVGILVVMLLIGTVLPVIGTSIDVKNHYVENAFLINIVLRGNYKKYYYILML